MKTILQQAKQSLKLADIPSYVLDAELLMAKALNISREQVICYPLRELSEQESGDFEKLLQRRIKREPMAHILEKREFWGREFKVSCDTLDPRPDSETLIEAALGLFDDKDKPLKILDFGTGTGCLLLTLLSELPNSEGVAVDISEKALSVAKENACKLGLAKRVGFIVSFWGVEVEGKYDLIISNPPYIKSDEIDGLEPEVSGYEPISALDGGASGLECYRQLAPFIASLLSDNGFAILEVGIGQADDVRAILEGAGLTFISCKKDLAGVKRCIIAGI